ncbi:MAG: AAA family ATPase, partial [Elusimicrobiota bacterium]
GIGKNALIYELARLRERAVKVLSLNENTEARDLIVRTVIKDGRTALEPSALVAAMLEGQEVVLDEVDRAPAGVLAALNHILQFKEATLPDGTVVNAKEGFFVWATRNPPRPPYRGEQLSGEFEDRFSVLTIEYLPEEEEVEALRGYAPSLKEELLRALVRAAGELRKSYRAGLLPRPVSIRALRRTVEVLAAYPRTPVWEAFKAGYNVGYVDEAMEGVVRKALEALGLLSLEAAVAEPDPAPAEGKELRRFTGHSDDIVSIALSPDGRRLFTACNDATIRLWDPATGEELGKLPSPLGHIRQIVLSADGRFMFTGGYERAARMWGAAAGKEIRTFEGHGDTIWSMTLSLDGRYLFTGSGDGTARMWDAGTGKEIRKFEKEDKSWVGALALSRDGRYLFTGDWDGAARMWDVETGKETRRFEGHAETIHSMVLSRDGRHLFTSSGDRTVRMWDVATGLELRKFEGHSGPVFSMALSRGGGFLFTGSDDQTARMWDVETGREVRRFEGHERLVRDVALSPDGRYLFTASFDREVRMWEVPDLADADERALKEEAQGRSPAPDSLLDFKGAGPSPFVAHTPATVANLERMLKNRLLGHSTLLVGEAGTGKNALIYELARLRGRKVKVLSLNENTEARDLIVRTVIKDGRTVLEPSALVAAMLEGEEVVLDEVDRAPAGVLAALNHILQFKEATLPDGTVVNAKEGFFVWATRNPPRAPYRGEQLSGEFEDRFSVLTIEYLPEEEEEEALRGYAPSLKDELLRALVRAAGELRKSYRAGLLPRPVSIRALRRTAEVLAAYPRTPVWEAFKAGYNVGYLDEAMEEVVRKALEALGLVEALVDPSSAGIKELRRFEDAFAINLSSLALSPDGKRFFTGGNSNRPARWDVAAGKVNKRFEGHTDIADSVLLSLDGKRLFSCGYDNTVRMWNARTGREIRRFGKGTCFVRALALSPDGRYLFGGGNDRLITMWDVETGREVRTFQGHLGMIRALAVSPDGSRLFSGGEEDIALVWDVKTGQELQRLAGHDQWVVAVAASPDGKHLFTASHDHTARMWDAQSGKEIRKFEGHAKEVWSIAVSKDGRRLFTGGHDRTIRMWDVETGRELRRFEGHTGPVMALALSPDGKRLLSASEDHTVRMWELPDLDAEAARTLAERVQGGPSGDLIRIAKGVLHIGEVSVPAAFDMAAPGESSRPSGGDRSKLLQLLEGLARMLTHVPGLRMAPWRSMGPQDKHAVWRMLFDLLELQFDPADLDHPDPDVPTGLTMHELWHLLFTEPGVVEEAFKNRTFHSLHNAVEDPRVNDMGQARHPGSRLWLRKLYQERYGIRDLASETAQMTREPLHLQFGYGLIYRWWSGSDDPRIIDPRVVEALRRAWPDIQQAYSTQDAAESYRIIRDKIWPVYKELVEESPRQQLAMKAPKDLDKLTPEQLEKLMEEIRSEIADKEDEFNRKTGGKLIPADKGSLDKLQKMREGLRRDEEGEKARELAGKLLEAERSKRSGVSTSQELGYQAYRAKVSAAIATLRAKWQVLFQHRTRKRALHGLSSGELSEGHLAEAMAGDQAVFERRLRPGKFRVAVSLLIDLSGSMTHSEKYKRAIEGAVLLMESLKDIPGVEFEIVGYNGSDPAKMLKEFAAPLSFAKSVAVVEGLERSVGGRNGDDKALDKALARIRERPAEQKIVILSSDGDPDNNIDRTRFAAQIRAAKDVSIFGLGIGKEAEIVKTLFPEGYYIWAENPSLVADGIYRILQTNMLK